MRMHEMLLSIPIICVFLAPLSAAEPPDAPGSCNVGSVYGKTITAADIGLAAPIDTTLRFDARDEARWELMGRIMTAFGGPVLDRFVKRHKIEATADEIKKFKVNFRKGMEQSVRDWETKLAELKRQLAAPNLSDADKAKLEEERAMYEMLVAEERKALADDVPEDIARISIVAWKTERELHRAYGGRVIFQQAGAEAVDARRRLFEEAEKKGDLKFDDDGVRRLFFYYSKMEHTEIDEKELERPWFFRDGK